MLQFTTICISQWNSLEKLNRIYKNIVKPRYERSKSLNLQHGEYEAMYNDGIPQTVAFVRCDTEKTKFLGSGSGSDEATLV